MCEEFRWNYVQTAKIKKHTHMSSNLREKNRNEIQKAICGEITEQIVLHQANNDANQRSKHRFLFQRN